MCRAAPRMRRQVQAVPVLVRLLIACLLWAFSLRSPTVQAQAVESVRPKARPSPVETAHLYPGNMGPMLGKEKKTRKTPSGPNPTGNHRPPTRH
ncbi:CLAVATA3/ESR (CLE)-related protein 46 [Eucalyptus grandis]|uniref:Uncharacterized protein n=3 Tax=Eucalyptus TaxID=3932 RepID=A0ACC3LUN6_EUCGR|nr:CLAVATA3/ESR (CLE)-related protein 46 [Eucalyptus grandis]KAK3442152.1 hypothetical protein EUGRSUZ_B02381 [Eucalyptus grandis]